MDDATADAGAAPQRVLVVELPEASTFADFLDTAPAELAVERFCEAPAARATGLDQYLGDPAASEPRPALRIDLFGESIELTDTREQMQAVVTAAYAVGGRRALAELRAAIGSGTPLRSLDDTPLPPAGVEGGMASAVSRVRPRFAELFSASEADLARMAADDLVQLEDAAVRVLREAVDHAAGLVAGDRAELLDLRTQGTPALKRLQDGTLVPRAQTLLSHLEQIAEYDRQAASVQRQLAILTAAVGAVAPPVLSSPAGTSSAADAAADLARITEMLAATRASPGGLATRILAATLQLLAQLARGVSRSFEVLRTQLFLLMKSRSLQATLARRALASADLVLDELQGKKVDAATVAVAIVAALEAAEGALAGVKKDLSEGRLSVLHGTVTTVTIDLVTYGSPPIPPVRTPYLEKSDFLTTRTPERTLAAGIEEAHKTGRNTIWDLSTVVQQALAAAPESGFADIGWADLQDAQRGSLKWALASVGLQIAGRSAAAMMTGGLSEAVIEAYYLIDGLTGAISEYGRYTKDRELVLAATYFRDGLVELEPSLASTLANALGAVSSAATLGKLKELGRILDAVGLGMAAKDLAPMVVEALLAAVEPGQPE